MAVVGCSASAAFLVRVEYREPTYEARAGSKANPFHWTYRIEAGTAAEAEARALRQFHRTTQLSSVGWVRQIVGVQVRTDG